MSGIGSAAPTAAKQTYGLTSRASRGALAVPPVTEAAARPGPPSGGEKLVRASLKLWEPMLTKEGAKRGVSRGEIPFQFNPKEVTIAKSAKWERKPVRGAASSPPAEFKGAEGCKLTVEMFFDATGSHNGSVVAAVEQLFSCCVPTEKSRDKKKAWPVLVVFQWGTINSFPAYVTQVSAKFTLFAPDGTPIRATCSVSMEEMPHDSSWEMQNPTSGSLNARRAHTVVAGDSLASLAYQEYGEAALWRPLADYNGIDDPMVLPDGRVLLLPALEDLVPVGG